MHTLFSSFRCCRLKKLTAYTGSPRRDTDADLIKIPPNSRHAEWIIDLFANCRNDVTYHQIIDFGYPDSRCWVLQHFRKPHSYPYDFGRLELIWSILKMQILNFSI